MEEHLNPLAVTHLLQHTLRSLCLHENSQWVYAVFWRILPRNYPPPKWEAQGAYERSRGNRRNWILVWEDGFCNFAASTAVESASGEYPSSSVYGNCEFPQYQGLQPELFFKMSHEIYNYGEGVIGKVAADYSHKWIHKEPNEQEINFLSAWHNSAESVVEDLSYVVLLRKRFSYIESIPGVLLPHPSSSSYPNVGYGGAPDGAWHFQANLQPPSDFCDPFNQPFKVTPSMSSLEALLSKLPSVVPPPGSEYCHEQPPLQFMTPPPQRPPLVLMAGLEKVEAKEEMEEDYGEGRSNAVGESSSSMSGYRRPARTQYFYHHQDVNSTSNASNNGF
ncbi:hypothetical protein BT93_B1866 [Corymbia citriodora subsp. variegata]|nr:hypothetical protein BT93_B1866 [Corymbia citriodora subsp. variegata]